MGTDRKKGEKRVFWEVLAGADAIDMVLMVVGLVGSIGDGLAFPAVMVVKSRLINSVGSTIHNGFTDPHFLLHNLNMNAFLMINIGVAAWFFCFLEGYCWTRTAERQTARMRSRYLKAVLRQDVTYFDTGLINVSEVVTSVSNDTLIIQECISEKVPNFLMNISAFIGCYTAAFYLLWRLAVVSVPFLVLLVVPGIVYGRVLISLARKMRSEYSKAGCIAEQAISSIRTIYAFVGESKTVSAFSESLQGLVKLGLKQGLAKGFALGSNGITFLVWSFTTWYATRLIMYHGAKGGTAFATGVCLNVGGMYLGSTLSNLRYFSEACAAGERIAEVINRVPSIDSDNMDGETLENIKGEVEFKDVKFAYPSRHESLILRGFSLKVSAGKTTALVGKSGSGKSTIISLLQRFYSPLEGEILLDGVAIDRLQLKWLRSQMGLVSQEPALFAMTIKENIMFGKEDASMEDIIEASIASNAHQFINDLPYGYETPVGERGVQLSGGQKQRIAIARAIIRKPRILLLDEATSALDSESELIVQEALDRVSKETTTIVIAHRLSTIRHADVISVVEEGQVVETGSHDELISVPTSLYSSLQQQGVERKVSSPVRNEIQQKQEKQKQVNEIKMVKGDDESCGKKLSSKDNKAKTKTPSFRRLVGLNSPEWKMGMLGCVSASLFGAVQPLYALAMGAMIAVFFLPSHEEIKRQTMIYSPCFVALAVFAFVTNVVQHYSFAYIGEMLTLRVREKMLANMLTFEVGWFDRDENSTGAICSRLANDANAVRSLVGDRTSVLVQATSVILISTTMGLIISWRLAAVMIVMQPLIIFCLYTRRVLLRKMARKSLKYQEKTSNLACEAVSNIRTITSFSSQSRILQMLDEAQSIPRKQNIRQSWYTAVALAMSQTITILFTAFNFWYGGKLILHGYMNSRQLFQTVMILERTGRFVADVGSMMTDLAKGADAVESVFSVLDRVSQIEPDNIKGNKPSQITGYIEIQNVDFAYPSRPGSMVFKGFSLDIQAGRSTALVGQSGSGKSTIIGLVERFYDPLKGLVKIDGQDIREYHLRSLRKHMALVSQEPALFAGSIRDNIMYGVENVDESEVVEAAKSANAHEFISSLKDGYDTWCGDKGMQLSGGQKQRIAIARAILKNPRILLLDEATSALDTQSERLVQDALEKMMVGRTTVVVAHRLTTIQNCDMIVVFGKGKIVETGNHTSLMDKGPSGTYYSLISLQTSPTM